MEIGKKVKLALIIPIQNHLQCTLKYYIAERKHKLSTSLESYFSKMSDKDFTTPQPMSTAKMDVY